MMLRLVLVLALSTALTAPAHAEPITTALFGAAFAATLGGAVVSTVLSVGVSLGFSWVASLFTQKTGTDTQATTTASDPRDVTYGERTLYTGIVGIAAAGGHFAHYNEYADATKAQLVFILADHWCEDLVSVKVDGKRYALVAQTVSGTEHKRYWVDTYGALIDIRFHDGRPGQAADTELVAQSSGWTSAYKYSGHCYVAVTVTSDSDKFSGSMPDFEWVVKGGRWYDRRKDSTAGGSGAHRFATPSTWEYTANPFVAADHLARGYYFNGVRVLGGQLPLAELDAASIIAAMNVADQTVTKPDASTRKRYEAHFVFDDSLAPIDLIAKLCTAGGGAPANMGGQLGMFAGAAQTSVMTITDADLVADASVRFSPHKTGDTRYSGVQGTYTRPDDDAAAPYVAIHSSTFAANDGRVRYLAFDIPEARDGHQAWMMAKQKLYGSRLDATAEITLDIKDLLLQVGDWFDWNSANPLRGERTWRIAGSAIDLSTARMKLALEEISADVFSDTATEADIEEPVRNPGVFGYLTTASSVTCSGASLAGTDGSVLPALGFAYDGIVDAAVSAVLFQYRIKTGPGVIITDSDPSPGDGAYYTSKGVAAGSLYEFRHKLDTLPGRAVDWSDWADALSATPDAAVIAVFTDFSEDVLAVRRYMAKAIGEIDEYVNSLGNTIGQLDQSVREEVVVKLGSVSAAVVKEKTARITETTALAEDTTTLLARVDDVSASGFFGVKVEAAPDGYDAMLSMGLRGEINGVVNLVGLSLLLDESGDGRILLDSDYVIHTGSDVSENGAITINWVTGGFDFTVGA